jgi:hypothetical protein
MNLLCLYIREKVIVLNLSGHLDIWYTDNFAEYTIILLILSSFKDSDKSNLYIPANFFYDLLLFDFRLMHIVVYSDNVYYFFWKKFRYFVTV